MAGTYSASEISRALSEQGVDVEIYRQKFENRPENALGERNFPSPVQIMNVATELGLSIPWEKIGAFVVCVIKGIWTKPLPQAAIDCAKQFGS